MIRIRTGEHLPKDDNDNTKVVLILGACCLDRLLTVPHYPLADSKIKADAYHEVGDGTAANTATAMALLTTASKRKPSLKIQLATKLGSDGVGDKLVQDLTGARVDLAFDEWRERPPVSAALLWHHAHHNIPEHVCLLQELVAS
jgi:sugar/nucleoside kinase (ribokinase family)